MQFTSCYPKSDEASQKFKIVNCTLSENVEDRVRIIFSFSLYAVSLLVALVIYFASGLGEVNGLGPLEGDEVCYHQHWKRVLVLVDFQNKASTV